MAMLQDTRALLTHLRHHPDQRARIRAAPNRALFYAGGFFKPLWKELELLKVHDRRIASKQLLPDVLASIDPGQAPHTSLLAWAKAIDALTPDGDSRWRENGYVAWRALSGIYASNAVGSVSFCVGNGVSLKDCKVFAATEIHVLKRNPQVDAMSRDALEYFERCVRSGHDKINFGLITDR